ncbi:hypothetical protein BJ546DRAFT_948121 [Cryomyces antarcticus]
MPEMPEHIQDGIAHLELEANSPAPSQHFDHAPNSSQSSSHDYSRLARSTEEPNFSPFPKLHNPQPNVPPTDEQNESTLEHARIPVLNSNDPDMQLAWAQDALIHVDAAIMHEERISQNQPARPVTPQVEHQLRVDAMNVVTFLADQHHPKAEFMRGMWLEFGKIGLRQDKREAFRCYSRAADKGYSRAEYRIGMQYEQSNDPIKALRRYHRGVDAGDSASNYRLGMMTLRGQHGQPQDYAVGVELIRKAAETADENAPRGAYVYGMLQARELPQINVPEMYLPFDERSARANIEKAAYLRFAKAQLKMGSAYELCTLGCEFDPALSLHYYALAARQGEPEADMAISKWFLCGYEGVFDKNEELAYTYAQRAAQGGLASGAFAMGYYNEISMYVPANRDRAMEWYEKAAKAGNEEAAGRIKGITRSGSTLCRNDHENLAISRIRSQYGSMRGRQPDRLKAQAPRLPSVSDGLVQFPSSSVPQNTQGMAAGSFMPPRSTSTAPYPLEDRPPSVPQSGGRAASVTPYPVENGPPRAALGAQRPGPVVFFNPDLRATSTAPQDLRTHSAFNVNPTIRPTTTTGVHPPARMTMPAAMSQSSSHLPQRPFTTVGNVGDGRGRLPSGHWGPAGPSGYRQPGGPSVERPEQQANAARPQPARLDIGYSAPPDAGKNRLQKSANPNKPQPRLPSIANQTPPRAQTVQPPMPHSQSSPILGNDRAPIPRPFNVQLSDDRPANARSGSVHHDAINFSRPGSAGRSPTRQDSVPPAVSGGLPATPPSSHKPGTVQTPGSASKHSSTVSANTPGRGPKTFEEMGVPQAPKESDCVIM